MNESGYREREQRSINRIRLEFKVLRRFILILDNFVLIESDWNLKRDRQELVCGVVPY